MLKFRRTLESKWSCLSNGSAFQMGLPIKWIKWSFARMDPMYTSQLDALTSCSFCENILRISEANFGALAGNIYGSRMNCHTVRGFPRTIVTDPHAKTWPWHQIPLCQCPTIRSLSYLVSHQSHGSTRTDNFRKWTLVARRHT